MPRRTQEDFERLLCEQIHFLKKSAEEYDKGDFLEAKRMTVNLRVLLHDTRSSTSLLTHLGKKDIQFYDTSIKYSPGNILPEEGLVLYQITFEPGGSSTLKFVPPLGDGPPSRYARGKVSFDEWWDRKLYDDKQGNTLTRKQLALAICNKDGGAHVDAKLNQVYSNVCGKSNIKILSHNGEGVTISDPLSANVRQITYEVLKSLEDEFPECFE